MSVTLRTSTKKLIELIELLSLKKGKNALLDPVLIKFESEKMIIDTMSKAGNIGIYAIINPYQMFDSYECNSENLKVTFPADLVDHLKPFKHYDIEVRVKEDEVEITGKYRYKFKTYKITDTVEFKKEPVLTEIGLLMPFRVPYIGHWVIDADSVMEVVKSLKKMKFEEFIINYNLETKELEVGANLEQFREFSVKISVIEFYNPIKVVEDISGISEEAKVGIVKLPINVVEHIFDNLEGNVILSLTWDPNRKSAGPILISQKHMSPNNELVWMFTIVVAPFYE